MSKKQLTPKQLRFCEEYVKDLNGTQAAVRAGYVAKRADQAAYELLRKPEISAVLQQMQKERSHRTGVTADRVVKEIARLAFFDARQLLREDGTPKPLNELDDDTAAGLAGVDVQRIGDEATVIKYKIACKNSALEKLARHVGIYNESADRDLVIGNPRK